MIELTPDAKRRFDEHLQRTRTALRGTRAVEADEVEQNVIEHVELALAGVPSPVGADSLGAVLAQLGPPERWLPDEELPVWRRTLGRLVNGPEDWRLAYLSFAVTALMFFTFPIGGVIVLPVAFCLSRACVELTQERGEPLGARAWLVLPPIWLAFLLFLGGALFLGIAAPAALASEQGMGTLGFRDPVDRAERLRMYTGLVMLSGGAWWIVLSGLFALLFAPIRSLFAPILARVRRSHLLILAGIGALSAVVGSILLWLPA
jgi:hypothetical protein